MSTVLFPEKYILNLSESKLTHLNCHVVVCYFAKELSFVMSFVFRIAEKKIGAN